MVNLPLRLKINRGEATMSDNEMERMYELMDSETKTAAEHIELAELQEKLIEYAQAAFGQNLPCFLND